MLPRGYTSEFGRSTHHAAEDVTEVPFYCADCQEERTFALTELDVAGYDEADLNPVLQDAVNGEPIFRCPSCGRLEPDLVNRHGYDYELRDTGYEVGVWQDEEGDPYAADERGDLPKPTEWNEEDARSPPDEAAHEPGAGLGSRREK